MMRVTLRNHVKSFYIFISVLSSVLRVIKIIFGNTFFFFYIYKPSDCVLLYNLVGLSFLSWTKHAYCKCNCVTREFVFERVHPPQWIAVTYPTGEGGEKEYKLLPQLNSVAAGEISFSRDNNCATGNAWGVSLFLVLFICIIFFLFARKQAPLDQPLPRV